MNNNMLMLEKRIARLEKLVTNEAKQVGTIYHVCSLKDYLKYILPNDTLQASGRYYNFAYGGNDYISFTRDKKFVVESRDEEVVLVQLVVDGDLLSERYKVRPYNDFAFGKDGTRKPDDFRKREMEECVKGPIKNISKYIKEVRFDIAACHEVTQEPDISLLKRKKSKLGALVYHRFIYGKSIDLGCADGTPLKAALKVLDEWLKSESLQEMLFSYDEDQIEEAIDYGADVNKKSVADGYPLYYYSEDDIMKMLLKAGANPNIIVENGVSLLTYTIDSLCDKVAKLLIKSGADIEARDINGMTPLMHAAESGSLPVIKALVEKGADINAKDKKGISVLSHADEPKTKKLLIKLGAVEEEAE